MLNISKNTINDRDNILSRYDSYSKIGFAKIRYTFSYMLGAVFFIILIIMFLPWTQNIQSKGKVVSLNPADQEQMIPSIISGRIQKWKVREGQHVMAGDTIATITEVKAEYLDPDLLGNTRRQIQAKEASMDAYTIKIRAYDQQIDLLGNLQELKLEQARNKIEQTRAKLTADSIAYQIAATQYVRYDTLYKQGLYSQTDWENYRNKMIDTQNKYLVSKNEFINAKIELESVKNEYLEKLAKAESERQDARYGLYTTEAEITKLQNMYSNYSERFGFYTILAPKDGFITKAYRAGVGETVKEGEPLVTFVSSEIEKAVEIYVRPVDLPLIKVGNKVRFLFDGWPAIFFRGWPNLSFGTFGGVIVGYDRTSDQNGNFRVLVSPDPNDVPWPELIQLGTGAEAIALLNRVPVWYEIWRTANGFPPDFYRQMDEDNEDVKAPKIKPLLK